MGFPLHRNVLVPGQGEIADPTAKVLHVPKAVLGPCVFLREDEFVTGRTPRDVHQACKISGAEKFPVLVKVKQVLEHFPTFYTGEARRVPTFVPAGSFRKNCNFPGKHGQIASGA